MISILDKKILDECYFNRFEKDIKNSLIYYYILLILLSINLTISIIFVNIKKVLNIIYKLSYLIGWYYCSLCLLNFLKRYFGDKNCNLHFNSISGHSNLVIFSILSLIYLRIENLNENQYYLVFHLFYLLFSFIVLIQTYIFGYHSLR
jgi:hypothetical protein